MNISILIVVIYSTKSIIYKMKKQTRRTVRKMWIMFHIWRILRKAITIMEKDQMRITPSTHIIILKQVQNSNLRRIWNHQKIILLAQNKVTNTLSTKTTQITVKIILKNNSYQNHHHRFLIKLIIKQRILKIIITSKIITTLMKITQQFKNNSWWVIIK